MGKAKAKAGRKLAERYLVKGKVKLAARDADDKGDFEDKDEALAAVAEDQARLDELQQVLYAQGRHAVLVVLQAMDTGGKDGTIRHVLGPLNPQGVGVASFKRPTDEELSHDYLWRIHRAAPKKGMIGVFNRSHYEDVLVARVHRLAPERELESRYAQINAFEKHLAENGTLILKFYLHITKDEQRRRLQSRLDDREKHWKFDAGDIAERGHWDEYMKAYEKALSRCSTPWAPWYVIPANRKWFRNFLVARLLRLALEGLSLKFPAPPEGLDQVVIPD